VRYSTRTIRALAALTLSSLAWGAPLSVHAQWVGTIPGDRDEPTSLTREANLAAEPPVPLPPIDSGSVEVQPLPEIGPGQLPQGPEEFEAIAPPVAEGQRAPMPTDATACPCCDPPGRGWRHRFHAWKRDMQASHWGYPEYFEEPPLGAAVYAVRDQQITRGIRDQLFLHHFDFYPDDTAQADLLTPYGERRLRELVRKAMACGLPLRIETAVGQPELDRARQLSVIEYCETQGLEIPADLILVGVQYRGIPAAEAVEIYRNQIKQTQSGGVASSAASGGAAAGNETNTAPIEVP
jgi:hypothetical protein